MHVGGRHLGYCTNVHPGETLADLNLVVEEHIPRIAQLLGHPGEFGAGLRIGHGLTRRLVESPSALERLLDLCQARNVYVFTVNGFPYGDFQASSVKASVYQPDWRSRARLNYTVELAELLARLPGPKVRTISTVAGGYKPDTSSDDVKILMAAHLREAATQLARVADGTGVHIRLCLEPEPWTTLETTQEAIDFFVNYLGIDHPAVREHLGLCYDCCHQAVLFEDASDSIRALDLAGIVIGKVQLSSALHLDAPHNPMARDALFEFAEPRYLHQVVALTENGILRCRDLPELAQKNPDWCNALAWRCHFHVPIQWRGNDMLGTTRRDWERTLEALNDLGQPYPHLEIETYTWSVLPRALRPNGKEALQGAIAEEFRAVLPWIKSP